MEGLKGKLICSFIGVSTGLSGIVSLSNCSAAGCSSCLRCAGVGFGIVLMILLSRTKRVGRDSKEKTLLRGKAME